MAVDRENQSRLRRFLSPDGVIDASAQADVEAAMVESGFPVIAGSVANLVSNPLMKEAREHIVQMVPQLSNTQSSVRSETYRHVYASRQEAEEAATDFRRYGCSVDITEEAGNRWVLVAVCPVR